MLVMIIRINFCAEIMLLQEVPTLEVIWQILLSNLPVSEMWVILVLLPIT